MKSGKNYKNILNLILFTALLNIACDYEPVCTTVTAERSSYFISNENGLWRLDTHLPVETGFMSNDNPVSGSEYILNENPPGEPHGKWIRQNTWYVPENWGSNEEFWYGWLMLDLYSIDRNYHCSPLSLMACGTEKLFNAFANDRFTSYYSPEYYNSLLNLLNGTETDSLFGIFYRVWPKDTLIAGMVVAGSPAWNAGLRADDRLLEFDGRIAIKSFAYLNDTAAHRPVTFKYFRPVNGLTYTVTIIRGICEMPSVYADTLPGKTGYMLITQFVNNGNMSTDKLFDDAASWLSKNSTGAWILDLRNNTGGSVGVVHSIISSLLPDSSDIALIRERILDYSTLGGYEQIDTMRTISDKTKYMSGREIYLLQNRSSASSSEIMISSLRENLKNSLHSIGDTSYGKGIGQYYISTPLNGFMAITCMHIDPIYNASYHGHGIAPDVYLTDNDSVVVYAWRNSRLNNALKKSNIKEVELNFNAINYNLLQTGNKNIPVLFPADSIRPYPVR